MKRSLLNRRFSLLFLLLFAGLSCSNSLAYSICHDCSLWIAENKPGKINKLLIKATCYVKRFITRRRCCCNNCYKNNPNYRVQVVRNIKDKFAAGMIRCDKCGQHHICHVCGKKLCLVDCNDHNINQKKSQVIVVPDNRVPNNKKESDKK